MHCRSIRRLQPLQLPCRPGRVTSNSDSVAGTVRHNLRRTQRLKGCVPSGEQAFHLPFLAKATSVSSVDQVSVENLLVRGSREARPAQRGQPAKLPGDAGSVAVAPEAEQAMGLVAVEPMDRVVQPRMGVD